MKILITGGSGLIGRELVSKLESRGYEVRILSRKPSDIKLNSYNWNIEKGIIDPRAFDGVEVLVHLAGEGIADKRWSNSRKKEIVDSRVLPIKLLERYIENNTIKLQSFICGSAIGYYGGDTGELNMTEDSKEGKDFLAECTIKWEAAADSLANRFSTRLVKVRTGVVLSSLGGALPKIVAPIKYGFGAALGSGNQWISWIHMQDLVSVFENAIVDASWKGAVNAVSPNPIQNSTITKAIAAVLQKRILLPNIPKFILEMILGEMSVVVLGSSKVLPKYLESKDFKFRFDNINDCLIDIYKKEVQI
jgi:uncharacterized protein